METKNESMTTKPKHILVVDDDKSVLTSTVRVLDRNGFIAHTAETGKEAIEKAKTQPYDAVLIDLKLPDMDGIDVLSRADFGRAVIIMLTGFPSLVSGLAAQDKGVDAYLSKPVRPE
ncbi:MAG: response regulator, partial [Methanocella sp.]